MPSNSLRRASLALAVLCALSACDRGASTDPAATTTPATVPAPAATTSGIDLAGIDKAVQPGDDFDEYANGAWRKVTTIPDDRANVSTFFYVAERGEKRLSDLIQGLEKANPAAGSNERKVADYYAAFMDEAVMAWKAETSSKAGRSKKHISLRSTRLKKVLARRPSMGR